MKLLSSLLFFILMSFQPAVANQEERAVFAGGCFWCMESPFEKLPGVRAVISGYTGGKVAKPTYEQVSAGGTGHLEAIQVSYNPKQVTYEDLLEVFWRNVDPTDEGGQFVDRGDSYRTGIFYASSRQKKLAEASKSSLQASPRFKKTIVTKILPLKIFYPAEEYHQDYYQKNPLRYKFYRYRSGRDQFLDKVWGKERKYEPMAKKERRMKEAKPTKDELKKELTDMQFKVTQKNGTEPPFKNEYWDHKQVGIYVDIVSGEPLFSSTHKFKSGTGWPSFTQPLAKEHVVEKKDQSLFMTRTEVRSKEGDSHLGHLFPDGPAPTGLRYCINSASLRFIPVEKLREEGYGEYLRLFEETD